MKGGQCSDCLHENFPRIAAGCFRPIGIHRQHKGIDGNDWTDDVCDPTKAPILRVSLENTDYLQKIHKERARKDDIITIKYKTQSI